MNFSVHRDRHLYVLKRHDCKQNLNIIMSNEAFFQERMLAVVKISSDPVFTLDWFLSCVLFHEIILNFQWKSTTAF